MEFGSKERTHRAVQKAIEEFNAGLYFECHETLENVWQKETDPLLRDFLQGFIHMAVAMFHQRRGNTVGSWLQTAKARLRWQNADLEKFSRMFECNFDEWQPYARAATPSQEGLRPSSIGLEAPP